MLFDFISKVFVIDRDITTRIQRHLIKHYPEEACGVLYCDIKQPMTITGVHFFENIQNKLHNTDRERYPRTSKDAFNIEPQEWLKFEQKIGRTNQKIICLFHSHIDCEPYFSEEDKLQAAPWGEPNYPDLKHLIISVNNGIIGVADIYSWDDKTKTFISLKGVKK